MSNKNSGITTGIGFPGLLTIAFTVLKLIGIIKWSWLWVISPIWITLIVIIILCLVLYMIG